MKGNKEFTITVPDPPTPGQVEALYLANGRNALASLIVKHIRQGVEKGTWTVINGKAVPIHWPEELQFVGRGDIIRALILATEEVL